jgi:putative DNA primase/helicase
LNKVRDDGRGPVLLVEGTKQHLAAASNLPDDIAVYGMAGCWGWTRTDLSRFAGRELLANFDADRTKNSDVWDEAKGLTETAESMGVTSAKLVDVPGPGSQGLDDFLAKVQDPIKRRETMARLVKNATTTMGRRPQRKIKNSNQARWFDGDSLKARDAAKEIVKEFPALLTLDKRVALYRDGVYRPDEEVLMGVVASMLDNDYRPSHFTTIKQTIMGTLALGGHYLPERIDQPFVNVRNGLVDLDDGELANHGSGWKSTVQFPITYDPAATCPRFDAWAKEIIGDQLPALLEAVCWVLDPSRTPPRAVLLFGPSRSGKGTFLRLIEAIVGKENTSSVSLHQLADDRFAAARVYGKALNYSGELSAGHIEDVQMFKMLTGDDPIPANPKFGKPFEFHNQALFAFSANEIPSVGESSSAYVNRMVPFKFGNSYAGAEDPSVERALREELPGIFNRLVRARQERRDRGHDLGIDAAVKREFEQASDRVSQWLDEEMVQLREWEGQKVQEGQQLPAEAFDETMDAKSLRIWFNVWAEANGYGEMGRNKLVHRLTSKNGVLRVRVGPTRKERFTLRKRREDEDPEGSGGFGGFSTTVEKNGTDKGQGEVH